MTDPAWLEFTNWQTVTRDGQEWLEIKTDNGSLWPDCSYDCRYCGACLGCVRNHVLVHEDYAKCELSPTGFHLMESALLD